MILDDIVSSTRLRIANIPPYKQMKNCDDYRNRSMIHAIRSAKGNSIISEVKFSSPSRGEISQPVIPAEIALNYEKHGASGVSVLTEPVYFNGSPECLTAVREDVTLPVLRKDFIIDEKQLYETRQMRADAVLLITALLGNRLAEFVELAETLSLQPLIEVHTDSELDLALSTGAEMIGINNRNLRDMTINTKTTRKLGPIVRECGLLAVSESGIRTGQDVASLKECCDAFLVGTSLMAAEEPGKLLEELVCA